MPLDYEAKQWLDFLESLGGRPVHELTPEKNRAGARYLSKLAAKAAGSFTAGAGNVKTEDHLIPVTEGEIGVRIYTPAGVGPFPLFVYFHGGGWIMGDLDSVDAPLRVIACLSSTIVISVAYRLAPEHKFPVALGDCYQAAIWAFDNASSLGADREKIAIGGDSAGGNLAAAVTLMAREQGAPALRCQILLYPVVDLCGEHPSHSRFSNFFLSKEDMLYFKNHYLSKADDENNCYASPLLADDLSGLPPALVVTSGYDPLHDEGEAYAARLKEAGAEVEYYCYEGMIHGFFTFGSMMKDPRAINSLIKKISTKLRSTDLKGS